MDGPGRHRRRRGGHRHIARRRGHRAAGAAIRPSMVRGRTDRDRRRLGRSARCDRLPRRRPGQHRRRSARRASARARSSSTSTPTRPTPTRSPPAASPSSPSPTRSSPSRDPGQPTRRTSCCRSPRPGSSTSPSPTTRATSTAAPTTPSSRSPCSTASGPPATSPTSLPGTSPTPPPVPNLATVVTPVAVTLPAAADDQAVVQVRVITADAAGPDEWVGIDNISVTGTPDSGGPAEPVASCPASMTAVAGMAASAEVSATDADSAIASIAITSAPVQRDLAGADGTWHGRPRRRRDHGARHVPGHDHVRHRRRPTADRHAAP